MTVPALRTVAFGDVEAGVWGVAWFPDSGSGFVAVGADGHAQLPSPQLDGTEEGVAWRLEGDGVELALEPLRDAVASASPGGEVEGFDQLCRARGRFAHGGGEQLVDCLGHRGSRTQLAAADRIDSIREISAWFEPDGGLALFAVRPRKSRGHGADAIAAAVLEPGEPKPVTDPRLSTTYGSGMRPVRAGLELWLGEGEQEQYPQRAAGEGTDAHAEGIAGGLQIAAELFRWHSRDRDGAGIYLLARRR